MIILGDSKISYREVCRVAELGEKVAVSRSRVQQVNRVRRNLESAVKARQVIYGVTTGFGAFKNSFVSSDQTSKLQENLIKSHSVGVGSPFSEEVVRAMMFLMVNSLTKGYSGVRMETINTLIQMLNRGVHPVVPQKGSVGSSGDLAPSAHLVLVLLGLGEALYRGQRLRGSEVLKRANLKPIKLLAKEGLGLINNTWAMTSVCLLTLKEAEVLARVADVCGALSLEALRGTTKAFDADIHKIRPHPGQVLVASRLRELLSGSTMVDNSKVQDQYSLRCIPQIHGGVREALDYVKKIVNVEIESVTDNPLIFLNEKGEMKVVSGGNFHGEPLAIASDVLGIAAAELANVSDRRIASLLDPANSYGLPPFLAEKGGLNSGMMILQYTTASLVSENKVLAHPASVDSIPTSANVEDLVSMGTIAARKARDIVENIRNVLAIELIVSCQAINFRLKSGEMKLGKGTDKAYKKVREIVPYFPEDAVYYPYIRKVSSSIDKIAE